MKASRYLHYLERGDQSYWYNAMENTYFKIPVNVGRKLRSLINTNSGIEALPSSLYEKMSKGKFIIDDDYDELQEIRRRYNNEVNSKNAFLIILPTLNCNYSCWYCIQDHIVSAMSEETLERIKKLIDNLIEIDHIESLHVDWFGGEPFMYFDKVIKPLSEYFIERCKRANIPFMNTATTNAYFLNKKTTSLFKKLNFTRFQITLDGNKENHDKVKFKRGLNSAFDRALVNINRMLEENSDINIILRINYTHNNITEDIVSQVCKLVNRDVRNRIIIFPRKVWQEDTDMNFSFKLTPILKSFEKEGFNIQYWDPTIDFVPCYDSRKYCMTINHKGHVSKCTASDDLYAESPLALITEDGQISYSRDLNSEFSQPTFENPKCLNCKLLPACIGICPRNHLNGSTSCKLQDLDINFEESVINYIDYITKN